MTRREHGRRTGSTSGETVGSWRPFRKGGDTERRFTWGPWVAGCVVAVAAASALSRFALPPVVADEHPNPRTTTRDGPLDPAPDDGDPGSAPGPVKVQEISVRTAVGPAAGRVVTPTTRPPEGGWPGMVLVAGSGQGRADSLLPWARRLAERGVASIVYDKRSEGYSFVQRDFRALADDAVVAAEELRRAEGVDPDRVGAAGFSEGGWIVPLMAETDQRLAAVVQLSGPNVTPNEQLAWQVNSGLLDAKAPTSAREAVIRILSLTFPGDLMAFGRFEPKPSLAAATPPLLTVFGLADGTVPVEDGARNVLAARSPADHSTAIRFVPDLGHSLTESGEPSPQVVRLLTEWLKAPPDTSSVRGGPAEQAHPAVTLPTPPAWLTPALLLASLSVVIGFILNRIGRRLDTSEARRRGRPLDHRATAAMVTWAGNNVGLGGLAATGALRAGAVPVALCWALVKISSAAVLVAGARAAVTTAGRGKTHGLRRAGAIVAGVGGFVLAVIGGGLSAPW